MQGISRRTALAAAGSFAVGGAAVALAGHPLWDRLHPQPAPVIPDAPEGAVSLSHVHSQARGRTVGLFTAVPAGHGDGAGLPVCMVLHGATATTADFRPFGLPRFLTAAVRAGAPPFVLAGLDGGVIRWSRKGRDDPQAMLKDELPGWLAERGFGPVRTAWGWSMGGYGVLEYATLNPGNLRAVAAFSPAVDDSDTVLNTPADLARTQVGIWCGTEDAFYPNVRNLVQRLPSAPQVVRYGPGAHTRAYWNSHTIEAFRFLAAAM